MNKSVSNHDTKFENGGEFVGGRASENRAMRILATIVCIVIPLLSIVFWFLSGFNWFVLLLVSLASFACEEWLGEQWLSKMFGARSRLSVENSGFSILRIVFGVFAVCLFFGIIFGLFKVFQYWFH